MKNLTKRDDPRPYVSAEMTNIEGTFKRVCGWTGPQRDKERLIACLEEAIKSMEWAALIINDISPKSHYMETIKDAKALIAGIKEQP